MPDVIDRPFVYTHEWWPDSVVEGVYRLDRHAPPGLPKSHNHPPERCGWTYAHGRPQLVEPGDLIVHSLEGRFVRKPTQPTPDRA